MLFVYLLQVPFGLALSLFLTIKKATVEKQECCEQYASMYYGRIGRKQAALKALAEHINVLAEIKQILDEEDDKAIKELFFNFKNRNK